MKRKTLRSNTMRKRMYGGGGCLLSIPLYLIAGLCIYLAIHL